jgi:hypothetical protein
MVRGNKLIFTQSCHTFIIGEDWVFGPKDLGSKKSWVQKDLGSKKSYCRRELPPLYTTLKVATQ